MIESLDNLGKAWLNLLKSYKDLFFLELKLARYSVAPFCFLVLLFIVVLSAFWLTSLAMVAYLIYTFTSNWLIALLFIELVSLLSVGLVFLFLHKYFKQLKFNQFRLQLQKLQTQDVNHESDESIKATN